MCHGLSAGGKFSASVNAAYDKNVNLDKVVDLFTEIHPRKLKMNTTLFESADTYMTFWLYVILFYSTDVTYPVYFYNAQNSPQNQFKIF